MNISFHIFLQSDFFFAHQLLLATLNYFEVAIGGFNQIINEIHNPMSWNNYEYPNWLLHTMGSKSLALPISIEVLQKQKWWWLNFTATGTLKDF